MNDEQNIIFIGRKPIFSYVMACVTQLNKNTNKSENKIHLRARGRTISRCVDCAEVLRNRYLEGQIEIESITTDTEKITTMEGETNNVSSIDIVIIKKLTEKLTEKATEKTTINNEPKKEVEELIEDKEVIE